MTTNFEKVQLFNRAFDMVAKEPAKYADCIGDENEPGRIIEISPFIHFRPHLLTDEPKLIRLRLDLIKEEIGELNQAIEQNDIIETRDALADILYVVYGMADVLGINLKFNGFLDFIPRSFNTKGEISFKIMETQQKYRTDTPPYITNFGWVRVFMDVCIQEGEQGRNPSFLIAQINYFYSELERICLLPAICPDDHDAIYKLLRDIARYVYMYCHIKEINADADFAIVHDSNMSKLCDTESDAIATVADYKEKYKAGISPYDTPYYYLLPELGKWIVKNKNTGKALKNIKYHKVQFV